MWYDEAVFYQIYPLGFCGAPEENDGAAVPRISKVKQWIPHLRKLGVTAVYFCPVFSSDRHGYDTRDYFTLDCRLGTNENFADVCHALRENGIRIVLDGVFHHVGRGFWAFQDVLKHREASKYRDWFYIEFSSDNEYGDGLRYEGWEGHNELVKLNLHNEAVTEHLFAAVRQWVELYGIDGLRLDVAYCLDREFLRRLRCVCSGLNSEFFLVGEILGGDYTSIANGLMCHSATNYECYKGLYSSLNCMNMFELAHSLERQFGPEEWTLYKGLHLLSFVDNHDVTRAASILTNPRHLPLLYALLFGMPGIPCLYYGSEWGATGQKERGSDQSLRPCFPAPEENGLTSFLCRCSKARRESRALCYGDYHTLHLTNGQLVFLREADGERVLVAVNAEERESSAPLGVDAAGLSSLLKDEELPFHGALTLPPYSAAYYRIT